MEKLACVQIRDHLNTYDLFEEFQSAYRQRYSTETALLRVKTDTEYLAQRCNGYHLTLRIALSVSALVTNHLLHVPLMLVFHRALLWASLFLHVYPLHWLNNP